MKTLFKCLIAVPLVIIGTVAYTQDICQLQKIYVKDSVGNRSSKIPQKHIHRISNDHLKIFFSDTSSAPIMDFQNIKKRM